MKTENQTRNDDRLKTTPVQSGKWILPLFAILCLVGAALAATVLRGHGSFTGQVTQTPLAGGLVDLEMNITGIVTHLGKCTGRLHTVADFGGALPTPVPPTTGVITAANGDTVSFIARWTVQEVSSGVFETAGPFEITGGTGRFKGATGGGDYRGLVDTNSGDVTCDMAGELRL